MFDFTEKDSCGVGFIASRSIPPTHGMTLKVLECLASLDHRGAKFADGTGCLLYTSPSPRDGW